MFSSEPIPARRAVLWSALALCAGLALPAASVAAAYPERPVRLVVPYPPGGATDVIGRVLAQELSTALGQQFVVENRAGAAGNIGADQVAKADPDGYTLLMGALTSHSINAELYKGKVPYDIEKSFAPVSIVGTVPLVFVVHPSVQAQSLQEFIALARAKPGYLTMASAGNGSPQHLAAEMFKTTAGVQVLHVPYKGSGPLTTDLLGGQIDMSFDTITPVLAHVKSGKLRALAVTTDQRSAALPEVPTLQEAGLQGFNMGTWFGVLAPAATPPDVVARLNAEMVKIIKSPGFGQRMAEIGAVPIGDSSAHMAQQIKEDTERYARLVKQANVAIN